MALFRSLGRSLQENFHYGADAATIEKVNQFQAKLEQVLFRRLGQAARDFGTTFLDRLRQSQKSHALMLEQKGSIDIFEGAIVEWLRQYAAERAEQISETVRAKVRKILLETFADGEGEAATAKKLREEIGGQVSLASAARIARTEAHTAASIGTDQAARSTGLDMVKEWGATEDSRTRPTHAEADGQQVEMNDTFQVGSASLEYPGDPNGPAKEIINCRCVVLYRPRLGEELL